MTDTENKYNIAGIQQVGIGVENFAEAWKYYIDVFNMDIRILEDDKVAELMLPYTGGRPQKRRAAIALNLQGGGGFEIWQYSERKPLSICFEIQAGDLGVFAAKIKSRNVLKTYELFSRKRNIHILGRLSDGIDGHPTFFMKDPFGNIFQIIHEPSVYRDEKRLTGGIAGAMIGVTDIEKAMPIYCDILGYDVIVADKTGTFDDLKALPAGEGRFHRRILSHSKPRKGSFSELFGQSYIELVQAIDRTPRKIYEGRYWGDPGFIQICFDVRNTNALRSKCEEMGYPFTVDSSRNFKEGESFDMGEAAGQFAYIEDPDGTLIELVEAHKIPLMKKLNLYLDLRKRDPEKPLPKWMLGMLRFMRVKPESL
ncbi:MAG: VOC family protein [Proteiniphilum sp.]|nr:VOC family protein [Proteiniphilum sp.]